MILQGDGFGTGNAVGVHSREIAEFFLCPQSNHLSRVVSRIAVSESIFAGDVAISILEDEDRRLVDFDRSMFVLFVPSVVDVRFFARGDTPVDFTDQTLLKEFEKNQTRARIEHLFDGGSIVFVLRTTLAVVGVTRSRRERTDIDLIHVSKHDLRRLSLDFNRSIGFTC